MTSISAPAEITLACPETRPEDPGMYPENEPYSELLLETMEAAEQLEGSAVEDVHSNEAAQRLFTDLLDNWQ